MKLINKIYLVFCVLFGVGLIVEGIDWYYVIPSVYFAYAFIVAVGNFTDPIVDSILGNDNKNRY